MIEHAWVGGAFARAPGPSGRAGRGGAPSEAARRHAERREVFGRQWAFVAHVAELPGAGDHVVRDTATAPVVAVRGEDGVVRVLLNECRHRGFAVCAADGTGARELVCGVHGWRYGLDGRLLDAAGVPDGALFDYRDRGLVAAAVETWNGLVFAYLGDGVPEPLAGHLDAVAPGAEDLRGWRPLRDRRDELPQSWRDVVNAAVALGDPGTRTSGPCFGQTVAGRDGGTWLHFGIQPALTRVVLSRTARAAAVQSLAPLADGRSRWTSRWYGDPAAAGDALDAFVAATAEAPTAAPPAGSPARAQRPGR